MPVSRTNFTILFKKLECFNNTYSFIYATTQGHIVNHLVANETFSPAAGCCAPSGAAHNPASTTTDMTRFIG